MPFVNNMPKALSKFLVKHLDEYDKVLFLTEDDISGAVKAGLPREKTELIYPIANTNIFKILAVNKEAVRKRYRIPSTSKVISALRVYR